MNNMATIAKFARFLVGPLFISILATGLIGCDRRSSKISRCFDNLHNVQICKQLWANDESKTTNDVPSWDDLKPYFPARWSNNIPICPARGSYKINRVGERPTCSIGGPAHSSPY